MGARAGIFSLTSKAQGLLLLASAMLAVGLAACGSSDGSVGVGSGQEPDPVALDFPIAYTKGPLRDENQALQVPTDIRDVQRFWSRPDTSWG